MNSIKLYTKINTIFMDSKDDKLSDSYRSFR